MAAPPTRRPILFLLGLVLILAALPVGWFVFLREPPAPPPPPPPPPVARPVEKKPVQLEVGELTGTVEVRHGGGSWEPARPGVALHPSDAVRTLEGGSVVLLGNESVEVHLEPSTEVSVEELTDSLSRILLGNGMATAMVRPGQRHTFEVRAAGSDAVARTGAGTFTMSNNGAGTVAVGTREGEVTLLGQGKVVIVRAGQQSVIRPGQAPTEPAPVPGSLLLKVDWPAERERRKRELVVTGRTDPGSRVAVEGVFLTPDAEGRFTRKVVLQEGRNTVSVRAVGVGGARQEEKHDVVVDTTPPAMRPDTQDIWKSAKGGSP
ncbi:hypothetical protein DRW03_07095 [Corallococcus sp. H22C18031201]|nr:hypothetical protein DRW03_07095 [Corallococcus sp. H22C18031201]